MNQTQEQNPEMIRVYFAVRLDGMPGYLNAKGECVDRGHVISPRREDAEAAALACICGQRPTPRYRGEKIPQRHVEVRSTMARAAFFH